MNNKNKQHDIIIKWSSLGIAFAVDAKSSIHADPEKTLISSLVTCNYDRKLLRLILTWFQEYSDLVHVERLLALMKTLSVIELAWLGGIASYQEESGDIRWRAITREIKKLRNEAVHFPQSKFEKLQLKRIGTDKHFKSFKLNIPTIKLDSKKKIKPRKYTIKNNIWLRMRALFGANWRADIAAALLLGKISNAYQAKKYFGCSYETAYRNLNYLMEADVKNIVNCM